MLKFGMFSANHPALQIPANEISAETPIIDLGVDSLVAAAIRSWFFTEHSADVPVLKILGGASIHQGKSRPTPLRDYGRPETMLTQYSLSHGNLEYDIYRKCNHRNH